MASQKRKRETEVRKTIEGILDGQINTLFHRNVYLCYKYHIGVMHTSAKSELAAHEKLSMQEMWYSD